MPPRVQEILVPPLSLRSYSVPNLAVLKQKVAQEKEVRAQGVKRLASVVKMQESLSDYASIQEMFKHEGWPRLQSLFRRQYDSALERLLLEEPLEDQEVQLLRAELIRADRILNLDIFVSERIQSLSKSIESNSPLADGQERSDS